MHFACPFYSVWFFKGIFICEGKLTHIMLQAFTATHAYVLLTYNAMGEDKKVVEAMKIYRICMQGSCEFCKSNRFSIDMRVFQNDFRTGQFGLSQISQYKFGQVKSLKSFLQLCSEINNYVSQKIQRAQKSQIFQLLMKLAGICMLTSRCPSRWQCSQCSAPFLKEKKIY